MRSLAIAILLGAMSSVCALEAPQATAPPAERMREAAEQLLSALPAGERAQLQRAFGDRDRFDWHYTPRSRNGIALKALDARGRDSVHALLRRALSESGYTKVARVIELESVLRDTETFGLMRDPERYHLTIYGAPDRQQAWGWRFEGHHLSLNFTLAGNRAAADAPSFLGANPATVANGPKKGMRVLAAEEDEARALLALLTDAQRREAIFETRTYGDIVTRNAQTADPLAPAGISAGRFDVRQRAQLMKLIEVYVRVFEEGLAKARLGRVREGGVDSIHFGWAGSTERGRPHYYRIQGPLFLIEYDASQGGGDHIHTVWRDFSGDFGRDLLREHYRAALKTSHRHR